MTDVHSHKVLLARFLATHDEEPLLLSINQLLRGICDPQKRIAVFGSQLIENRDGFKELIGGFLLVEDLVDNIAEKLLVVGNVGKGSPVLCVGGSQRMHLGISQA